jgi:hypothetical protein
MRIFILCIRSSVDLKIWVGNYFWVLKSARNTYICNDIFITTINHALSLCICTQQTRNLIIFGAYVKNIISRGTFDFFHMVLQSLSPSAIKPSACNILDKTMDWFIILSLKSSCLEEPQRKKRRKGEKKFDLPVVPTKDASDGLTRQIRQRGNQK